MFIYLNIVPAFPISEQNELTRQLKRAVYSVPFNIVEGVAEIQKKILRTFWICHLVPYWK